jgi:transposase
MSASSTSQIRFVGIRPRVKQTAEGEARPTQVCLIAGDSITCLDLDTEQAELDFVLGVFPTAYRKVAEGEDLKAFREHHIQLDSDEKPSKVPSSYEGLRQGDVVAMVMGGSGDYLAFALSRQGEKVGATVVRIPPFVMAMRRGPDAKKDADAEFLARLAQTEPGIFTPVYVRDRMIVAVRELQRLRVDTMKARIGCQQRLRQRFIGKIFCSKDGLFPEGAIEKEFDAQKANDTVLVALETEEARIDRELKKASESTDIWKQVLSSVSGCGPAIASRLITVIQDIRRFETAPKLRKYLGVHVEAGGKFPRRRAGQVAGWSGEGRQALFLLVDQFNRRPDSAWGKKFLENKAIYQAKYPHPHLAFKVGDEERTFVLEPSKFTKNGAKYLFEQNGVTLEVAGKMRYFKGHLHKMAGWRTASQFVDWLFTEWWKLEGRAIKPDESSTDGQVDSGPTTAAA